MYWGSDPHDIVREIAMGILNGPSRNKMLQLNISVNLGLGFYGKIIYK